MHRFNLQQGILDLIIGLVSLPEPSHRNDSIGSDFISIQTGDLRKGTRVGQGYT
jgi:hypothetical protein